MNLNLVTYNHSYLTAPVLFGQYVCALGTMRLDNPLHRGEFQRDPFGGRLLSQTRWRHRKVTVKICLLICFGTALNRADSDYGFLAMIRSVIWAVDTGLVTGLNLDSLGFIYSSTESSVSRCLKLTRGLVLYSSPFLAISAHHTAFRLLQMTVSMSLTCRVLGGLLVRYLCSTGATVWTTTLSPSSSLTVSIIKANADTYRVR